MENYLKVQVKRNYGNGNEVVIELSATKAVPSDLGLVEFDLMVEQINSLFDHFAIKHLPSMRFSAPSEEEIRLLPAVELRVKLDKGKRYILVCTPEYSEFGINWWPEDMKTAGINPKTIPEDGYKCKEGSLAEVKFQNGKPKKVIRIIAPQ